MTRKILNQATAAFVDARIAADAAYDAVMAPWRGGSVFRPGYAEAEAAALDAYWGIVLGPERTEYLRVLGALGLNHLVPADWPEHLRG